VESLIVGTFTLLALPSHYSAELGATQSAGLPRNLFATGEARWLGVQISGQAEQPRTLPMSVPYALKAADAQTLGGLPASAFLQTSGQSTENTTVISSTKQVVKSWY